MVKKLSYEQALDIADICKLTKETQLRNFLVKNLTAEQKHGLSIYLEDHCMAKGRLMLVIRKYVGKALEHIELTLHPSIKRDKLKKRFKLFIDMAEKW